MQNFRELNLVEVESVVGGMYRPQQPLPIPLPIFIPIDPGYPIPLS
jgi:hypothetical protein